MRGMFRKHTRTHRDQGNMYLKDTRLKLVSVVRNMSHEQKQNKTLNGIKLNLISLKRRFLLEKPVKSVRKCRKVEQFA